MSTEPDPTVSAAARETSPESAYALRVLVTDDEMGMRLGVVRTLQRFRVHVPDIDCEVALEVDQADTGELALEKIGAQPPDILLLDHKMPGMSGLEVLDWLGKSGLEILTIMLTAYATIDTAVTATQRGAYDFLAKPFTPDDLRNRVAKAVVRIVLAREVRRLRKENQCLRDQLAAR